MAYDDNFGAGGLELLRTARRKRAHLLKLLTVVVQKLAGSPPQWVSECSVGG